MDFLGSYDVVVIGAGHAGIEAAHAAAKLGAKTALFTPHTGMVWEICLVTPPLEVLQRGIWCERWTHWAVL